MSDNGSSAADGSSSPPVSDSPPSGSPPSGSPASRPAWLTLARYEANGRWRGVAGLTGLLSAFVLVFLGFFPSMKAADLDLDEYAEALPEVFREVFGIISLSTVEGFLAVEFYQFAWLLLVGLYLAYVGGETIAADLETRRMDLTLAAPMRRRDVVIGKFLGLVPLVLVLNSVLPVVAYAGVIAIGETIAFERLAVAHALAVPYHLACIALGVLTSTLFRRASLAQRVSLGALFALFMFESLTAITEYDVLGAISPTNHYDPSAILVTAEYDWTGGLVLLAGCVLLVGIAVYRFVRADLTG